MLKQISADIDAVLSRDPAARGRLEVMLTYPGLHAVIAHRMSHGLWKRGYKLPARMLSYFTRSVTGIEIHPGAKIGDGFFIDHGVGVVIGETAEVGNNVTLYQGVTLGGTSLDPGKRHPTVDDDVIVGAGAKVLGPLTLGRGARVGSNAVVVKDVTADTTVVGIPAKPVERSEKPVFEAYGTPCSNTPDPVACMLENLTEEITSLRSRLVEMEAQLDYQRSADKGMSVDMGTSKTNPDEGTTSVK